MVDSRIPLIKGTRLKLKNGITYEILEIIGRGANCLVYDAQYFDCIGVRHIVRIKELFPTYLSMNRDEEGTLVVNDFAQKKFDEVKHKFKETYKRNVEIRNMLGLVNSTSNVQELLEGRGTYYLICVFDEGIDYRNYQDSSVFELLKHMKALTEVIGKYHQNGFLHLDIKPENVFILPETAEHIILFDFDSVVSISSIANGTEKLISYSDGFSAPEQVSGNIRRIGPWSDIYSIGAVLAYKLFGKVPSTSDMQIGKELMVKELITYNDILSPKLMKMITHFLKKILAISSYARWNSVDLLIDYLDQMIPLADSKAMFLVDNFVYNESHFVGRKKEIEKIHDILNHKQAVFLSGIGGIGKTELAKRYAYCSRDSYNTIVFLRFEESIKNTVISNDLEIQNFEYCDESQSIECFKTKFDALKKIVTAEDLLIIDNFDVDYDEDLELLLELKCKIIFTTREDYRDYNYEQIDIDCMNDSEDAFHLFCAYNENEYSDEEQCNLIKIFKLVDYHTMMIVLLSKYLRDSEEYPSELFEKFCLLEGTSNTGDTRVKHRKDKRLRAQRVNAHLQSLFTFSDFSNTEIQIMRALSLLGPIRIQLSAWLEMTGGCFSTDDVIRLIKRGWIEGDIRDKNGKISLHQIILDLVYNEQTPNTENCCKAIEGYLSYIRKREKNLIARRWQKRIADILLQRLQGTDCLLAKFYYLYCKEIKYKADLLLRAESLCSQKKSGEGDIILSQIETLRMEHLDLTKDFWNLDEKQMASEVDELYKIVFRKELKIFQYMISSVDGDSSSSIDISKINMQTLFDALEREKITFRETECHLLLDVAEALCTLSNRICMENSISEEGAALGFSVFFMDAKNILSFLERYTLEKDIFSFEFKEKLLLKLIDFYKEDDFLRLVQAASVGDAGKSAYYTERLNKLRKSIDDNQDVYWLEGISYIEAAEQEMLAHNYKTALKLYYKALKNEESVFDDIMYRICDAYIRLQDFEKAEKGYFEILEYDIQQGLDVCFTYQALVDLFEKKGDDAKVKDYSKLILEEKLKKDDLEDAEWIIAASMNMISQNPYDVFSDNPYMQIYLDHLGLLLRKESIDERIVDSLEKLLQIKKEISKDDEQLVNLIYQIANRFREQNDDDASKRVYRCLINHKDIKERFIDVYMHCLLWSADLLINDWKEDYKIVHQLLQEVYHTFSDSMVERDYYFEKFKMLVTQLWKRDFVLSKDLMIYKDENYNLIFIVKTELDERRIACGDSFQIWLDTTEEYISRRDKTGIIECINQLNGRFSGSISSSLVQRYINTAFSAIKVLDSGSGAKVKAEMMSCISDKLQSPAFEKKEIGEIMKCLFRSMFNINLYNEGIPIFIEWLYTTINSNVVLENLFETDFSKIDISLKVDKYLQETLETQIAAEIVAELEFVIRQLQDDKSYYPLKCDLESIKRYYEQTTIEIKH